MYCIQTAEDIIKLLSLPGAPSFLIDLIVDLPHESADQPSAGYSNDG